MAGLPLEEGRRRLVELTRAHLLAEHVPGRYAFHGLLRVYAAEQAQAHDSDEERHQALQRVLDHYLCTAHSAARILNPLGDSIVLPRLEPSVTPESITDDRQAWDWFTAEHQVVLAAIARAAAARAAAHELETHICQLSQTWAHFLDWREHRHDRQAAPTRRPTPRGPGRAHRGLPTIRT